jgi:hypothetical protein
MGSRSQLPISVESNASLPFYFLGEVPYRFLGHHFTFTAADGRLGHFHCGKNFSAATLVFHPKLEGYLDGVLGTRDPAIIDGLPDESLLIGAQIYLHAMKRRLGERPCQA